MSNYDREESRPRLNRENRKQVRLTMYDNEPMARLAEQRLRQAGIPSYTRSLRGGPGLWGSAYNLPHDLYVQQRDVLRAREVLELPFMEQPSLEASEGERQGISPRTTSLVWWVAMGVVAAVLVLGIVGSVVSRLGG